MSGRYEFLRLVYDGYKETGELVSYNDGRLQPFKIADDIGLFVVMPKLAYAFNLSIESALLIFMHGMIVLSFTLAAVGFFLCFRSLQSRIYTVLNLILLYSVYPTLIDTVKMYLILPLSIIPLAIYFLFQKAVSWKTYIFLLSTGLMIGFGHYMRGYSGLAPLIFVTVLVIFSGHIVRQKKALLVATMLLGMIPSAIFFHYEYSCYSSYTQKNFPGAYLHIQHPLWHCFYDGFGFLAISHLLGFEGFFNDGSGYNKAMSIDSTVKNDPKKLDNIMCTETIKLFYQHPVFTLQTIFAKLGVLLLYFLFFANVGVFFAFYRVQPKIIETAYLCSLAASSVFSIIAVPILEYSFGFIAGSTIYGILSIGFAFEKFRRNSLEL